MKNPFAKQNNTAMWIGALAGVLAAGTGIWFYLQGRRAAAMEAERLAHAQDYLKPKKQKKHKSDLHDLEDIVHHQQL